MSDKLPKSVLKSSVYSFLFKELKMKLKTQIKEKASEMPSYRYNQLHNWLYKKKILNWTEAVNLPKSLTRLLKEYPLEVLKTDSVTESRRERDNKKFLFEADDGVFFEAVLIPSKNKRFTVCLSAQAGCGFGCVFCATGTMKLQRNLTVSEMIEQYIKLDRYSGSNVKNIVFMGMGEPLANFAEVTKTIRCLTDRDGFALSPRRISVSTVGIPEKMKELDRMFHGINLLLSLHSASEKKRAQLIPGASHIPLAGLLNTLKDLNNDVTIEYVMIDGVNDTPSDLKELVSFLKPLKHVKVNLIAYNKNPGMAFKPSTPHKITAFKGLLEKNGMTVTQRFKVGIDINAGCGQLAVSHKGHL